MKVLVILFLAAIISCNSHDIDSEFLDEQIGIQSRSPYTLTGKIAWSGDTTVGVGQVTVNLTGPESQSLLTGNDGLYSFTVTNSGNYTITPSKTINLLNGVTGVGGDATLVQQYVAGLISLNTFQIIAADANKSNTITTTDATIINQAFLGNPSAQNILKPSWTFVDRNYVFGSVPPIPAYPKTIIISVNANVNQLDFVGIKRGDVNNSCNPAN